jgi:hypothetical protein
MADSGRLANCFCFLKLGNAVSLPVQFCFRDSRQMIGNSMILKCCWDDRNDEDDRETTGDADKREPAL